MSDGTTPAVDKVDTLAPTVPEAPAKAPNLDNTPSLAVSSSGPAVSSATVPAPETNNISDAKAAPKEQAVSEGAGPAVSAPKPVEVMSVPETPINGTTPAGGTPRPVLNIPEEPIQKPAAESAQPTGEKEPLPTPTASDPKNGTPVEPPEEASNSAEKSRETTNAPPGALEEAKENSTEADAPKKATGLAPGEKRKIDDETNPNSTVLPVLPTEDQDIDAARVDKKPKIDNDAGAKPAVNGGSNGKAGKPKKEKKPPVVGRALRKTRSQGPVET